MLVSWQTGHAPARGMQSQHLASTMDTGSHGGQQCSVQTGRSHLKHVRSAGSFPHLSHSRSFGCARRTSLGAHAPLLPPLPPTWTVGPSPAYGALLPGPRPPTKASPSDTGAARSDGHRAITQGVQWVNPWIGRRDLRVRVARPNRTANTQDVVRHLQDAH